MTMVVPNDFVGFQIPALDHLPQISAVKPSRLQIIGNTYLIFSSGEQIWMSCRNRESSNGRNVSRQGELKLATCKVPYLQQMSTCQHSTPNNSRNALSKRKKETSMHQKKRTLITRSPAPVANHLLPGSTATLLTQPKCPEMTRTSFQGG